MTDTAANPAAQNEQQALKFETIELETPIIRGEQQIEKVTLRKPSTGELRGLNYNDLTSGDVTTTMQIIPRISDPILTSEEVANMDPADSYLMSAAVVGFFMNRQQREFRDQMLADALSKT